MSARAAGTARARGAAAPVRHSPPPLPRPSALPRPRRGRPRLGWLIIPLIAVMLGGVVWVNVARLNVTTRTSATVERYRQVQSEIAQLRARLAQRDGEVIDQARSRLGMVQAPSKDVRYLEVPPSGPPAAPRP